MVNMSVAPVAQNKTKIPFFYVLISFYFGSISRKNIPGTSPPILDQGFTFELLEGLQHPPDLQLYTRALHALPSIHLNNQSIKTTLFQSLEKTKLCPTK